MWQNIQFRLWQMFDINFNMHTYIGKQVSENLFCNISRFTHFFKIKRNGVYPVESMLSVKRPFCESFVVFEVVR